MRTETQGVTADVRRRRAGRLLKALGFLAAMAAMLWDAVDGLRTGVVWFGGRISSGPIARATDPFWYWLAEVSLFVFGGLLLPFCLGEFRDRLRDARARSITPDDAPDPPPAVVTRPDGVAVFRDGTPVYTTTQVREAGIRIWLIMGGTFVFAFCMLGNMGWSGQPPAHPVDLWGWRAAAALAGATVLFYLLTAQPQPNPELDRAYREAGLPTAKPPRPMPFPAVPGVALLLLLGGLGVFDRLSHRPGDALPDWIVAGLAAAGLLRTWRVWLRIPRP